MQQERILRTAGILMGIFFVCQMQARHIIGGGMTYTCLGEGNYEFEIKVYRDCFCTDCAEFDTQAFVAVYRCNGADCNRLSQSQFLTRVNVGLNSMRSIEAPDYPCLIPPDICVEEGTYRFSLQLPVSDDSYHISYQRCCRNVTINNLIAPDDQGATYTVEITPEAQRVCNSSPQFRNFPPTVICAGEPLEFDHSATDADGDQLVYEFCAPFQGGGPITDDPVLFATCQGAYPNPACPPPYRPVNFAVPNFTPTAPLGFAPDNPTKSALRIDPTTGRITGVPPTQGQFVVGVCVSEYRNGVLLSRIVRDFQFNVASCDPQVFAQVQADEVIDGQQYLINSCGVTDVTIKNESFLEQFIREYEWRFDINGQQETYNEWDPTVTFPGEGNYEGQLLLNPGTDCGDTATVFVNIFPAINADFEFAYDTCVAGPVAFTDLSVSGSGQITDWAWELGDGNTSNEQNPNHTYRAPGDIPASLTVTDINNCRDTRTRNIPYFPVPAVLIVSPSEFLGCTPAEIFFNNLSTPIDETYDIFWDFGDGGSSTDISPVHTFENPGTYSVSLDLVSPIGCETDTVFNDLITVQESPAAGFTFAPPEPSNIDPQVFFTDQSARAIQWFWDFDDGTTSTLQSPTHSFRDTGRYEVLQVVTHPSGCMDTLVQLVDVRPEVRYHLPNAFTPNGDGLNDAYLGVGLLDGATNFSMSIWNRWGEMIFETSNPDEGWNGRKFNSGAESPNGVYVVVVTFRGPRGEEFEFKTFATLIR
jgi:gliding motility-associated-like protein